MSNAQGISFLSLGLIVASAEFPYPFNVRFGVDNGAGEIGTLTIPSQSDVRAGIQYGGNGSQYTGTLYVSSAGTVTTWTQDMLDLWHEEIAEWPCKMQYESWEFDCVRNPIRSGFQMTQTSYNETSDTTIDILRSDAITCGLYGFKQDRPTPSARPVVRSDGMAFQVIRMENDDTAQPSVRFTCAKLQSTQ